MGKVKEEPKAGVPAFMATFADLMTLLLVFFILLNVYAREKQHGLLSAASGSFANALQDTLGLGGLLKGSQYMEEQKASTRTYNHHDEEPGKEATQRRQGDEVELKKSSAEKLDETDQVEMAAPFVFEHGSSRLPAAGRKFLDSLSRQLQTGNFVLEIKARAAFLEAMTPMELACDRVRSIVRYMRQVGLTAPVEIQAGVMPASEAGTGQAPHRGVEIKITRRR